MIRSPLKLSGSVPDLSSEPHGREYVTQRKRKHSSEYQELMDIYTDRIMGKLTEWKTEIGKTNNEINEKLATLASTSQDLKSEINSMRKEFTTIKNSVQELTTKHGIIQKDLTELQQSVQFNGDQQSDMANRIQALSKDVQTVSTFKSELNEIRKENQILRSQLNANDQRDRLPNVEIIGIPEVKGENLYKILEKMCLYLEVPVSSSDIMEVNRVSSRTKLEGRPRVIIAKMRSRQLRDSMISRARRSRITTRDIDVQGDIKPVYINEHLTPLNKIILKRTKEAAKTKNYQFTWTKNGRIFTRKNETTQAIQIITEEDLKKII